MVRVHLWGSFSEDADESARGELLEELRLMKKLGPHPNIITLLGHCTKIGKMHVHNSFALNQT